MSAPADRIERFLRENPSGPLWVTVGFASAFGLAWLNERTRGRPVTLLIGDTRTGFAKYSEDDRRAAIRFVQRPDVSVRNWYRKHGGHRTAHAKTWMVEPDPNAGIAGGILVGSANLTRQGLLQNVEMLTLADPSEHRRLRAEIHEVMDESWAIEDRLLGLLGATKAGSPRVWTGTAPMRRDYDGPRRPEKGSARRGSRYPPQKSASPTRRDYDGPRRPRQRPARAGSRHAHRRSASPKGRELRSAALMIAAGVVLLFVLLSNIGRDGDSADSPGGSNPPVAAPSPPAAGVQTVAPVEVPPPPAADPVPGSAAGSAPATTVPDTLAHRPEIELSAPPEGWTPYVGGNASTYGEPDRDDLQWVAWQPTCPSCEPGVTMSWVGSYAYPFNDFADSENHHLRAKLLSSCFHRERSGPLIQWQHDIGGDHVASLWIDGERVPTGSWWLADGGDARLMVPEPGPFLALLEDAQELRIVTAERREATFTVAGFLSTPVQANLDHCDHYS